MVLRLTDLSKNEAGIITGFDASDVDLCMRLREIGFAEGDNVTPLHDAKAVLVEQSHRASSE